jgi:hypothetical protein
LSRLLVFARGGVLPLGLVLRATNESLSVNGLCFTSSFHPTLHFEAREWEG